MSYPPYQGGYPQAPGYPQPGGMPQPAPAPTGLPYAAQPYPNAPGYPSDGAYPQGGAYPPQGGFPVQGGMPMAGQSAYPSPYPSGGTSFPTASAPYPSGGTSFPTGSAPYPTGGNSYPPGAAPYPSGAPPGPPGAAPYPSGATPYPSGAPPGPSGAAPYPSGAAPYPSGAAPGPSGAAPYPSAAAPYPSSGDNSSAPYPASSAPSGNSSHSHPSASYPSPGTVPYSQPSAPTNYPPKQASSVPYSSTGNSSLAPSNTGSPPPRPSSKTPISGAYSQPAQSGLKTDANSTLYYECAKKPGDSGSVKPLVSGFNPETDATQIKSCLKGASLNETVLVNILPHRSNAQRQKIRLMYKTMYGKDLLQDLRGRLSGDLESLTAALLMKPAEYDAYLIYRAIQGAGTDEDVLIEILCTRTNTQMREILSQYKETYRATIEQHVQGDTSGHFKRMLISLSNGARQEDQGVDAQKAENDAKKLYKAGAGRLGTDESAFNSVFVSQSFEQLRAVFSAYKRLYNKDIERVIKSEMSGDLERGMKAIVRFTLDKHSYFANVLYKAMKGIGTDEKSLIRTLVSRSEIDLEQINRAFSNIKGESKPLAHWIKKETSGPFRDMMIHVIGAAR